MAYTLKILAHSYTHARGTPPRFPFRNERSLSPAAGSVTSRQSSAASSLLEIIQLKRAALPKVMASSQGWLHTQHDTGQSLQEADRGKTDQKWHWLLTGNSSSGCEVGGMSHRPFRDRIGSRAWVAAGEATKKKAGDLREDIPSEARAGQWTRHANFPCCHEDR